MACASHVLHWHRCICLQFTDTPPDHISSLYEHGEEHLHRCGVIHGWPELSIACHPKVDGLTVLC